jgi:hypothetical protein
MLPTDYDDLPMFEKTAKNRFKSKYTSKQIWTMCLRKRSYARMSTAKEVIVRAKAERQEELRAYRCPVCKKIHVTKRELFAW